MPSLSRNAPKNKIFPIFADHQNFNSHKKISNSYFFCICVDFHFIAPDLQGNREIIEIHGFDQDILRDLPKPIQVNPTYDLLLKNDIYIRTSSVAEVIKQFIIPKKTVRFAKNVVHHEIRNNRHSNENQVQRFSPYNADQRRSARIARRCTRSMSMSL